MFDTARVLQRYAKVLVWLGLSLAAVALLALIVAPSIRRKRAAVFVEEN